MARHFTKTALLAGTAALLLGCSSGAYTKNTAMDRNWGRSFETARSRQILNPDAGKNQNPVQGLDGDGAVRGLEQYRRSFEKTDTNTVYSIDVSGLGGAK